MNITRWGSWLTEGQEALGGLQGVGGQADWRELRAGCGLLLFAPFGGARGLSLSELRAGLAAVASAGAAVLRSCSRP